MQSNDIRYQRRARVLGATQHLRTGAASLRLLTARGVATKVTRGRDTGSAWTQVEFRHGDSFGTWKDHHAGSGHFLILSGLPLPLVPALILAPNVEIDPQMLGYDQPGDFVGEAAQFLREQTGAVLSLSEMLPEPGAPGDELSAPMYSAGLTANWGSLSAAVVSLSGPGLDACATVQFSHLTERQARRVIDTYARRITQL